jgi:hypothetical protein
MKSKPPKEIRERRAQRPKPQNTPQPPKRSVLKMIELILGIGLGIAGTTLTALQFRAKPTVSLESPLDPKNILTAQFVISNEGQLAINGVNARFIVLSLQDRNRNRLNTGPMQPRPLPLPNQALESGDRMTVGFPSNLARFGVPIVNFDLVVVVQFTPAYAPWWHKNRPFRLTGILHADDTIRLQQQPIDEAQRDLIDKLLSAN